MQCLFSFIIAGLLFFSIFTFSGGEGKAQGQSLILLQNSPHMKTDLEEDGFSLTPLYLTEGGGFMEASENLEWSSSNKNVADVNENGEVRVVGKPGRSFISVSNGVESDRIAVHVTPKEGANLVQQEGDQYNLIERAMDELSLEEKIGQMMMPDFRTWNGENVTEMLPEIEALIQDYHIGGVILFRENVVETEQIIDLVEGYKNAANKFGMLVTIDQEGGIVTRLQNGTDMPGNMALGATRSEELSFDSGRVIGAELEALGINMNLAPVLDVNNNPDNPVIGVRSYGEDPDLVGKLGSAYTLGLQEHGIAGTAKHFPGHGDTDVDSHLGLPEVPHDRERLFEVELPPFQEAMENGMDAIMTAHVTFPKIDDTKVISKKDRSEIALPATLSEKVLTGLVRDEMGYEGVIMTDALNMNAIADHFGPVDAVIRAINAGTDIVLMPVGLIEVFEGVHEAVLDGEISEERIDEAVERILTLKLNRSILKTEAEVNVEKMKERAHEIIGSEGHLKVEQKVAERAVTVVKNDNILPLEAGTEEKIVVVGATYSDSLFEAIGQDHENVEHVSLNAGQSELTEEQQETVNSADSIIIGSYTFDVAGRSANNPHMQVYQAIVENVEVPVVGVGIRNPYDIMAFEDIDAYVAQYGFRDASFDATVATLFGQNEPSGQLPVTIFDEAGEVLYPFGHGITFE